MDTAEDQNAMFSRLAGKSVEKTNDDDFNLDDMFESRANRHVDEVASEARDRQRAINEHEKREKVLDSCSHCLDSKVTIINLLFTHNKLDLTKFVLLYSGYSETFDNCYWTKMLFILTCSSIPG